MKVTIRGKNLTVADSDRAYVERKLQRLDRMLDESSEADVELRQEQRSSEADRHAVDVTLLIHGRAIRATATATTFRAATDIVVDKLERQTVEHKKRPRDRARASQSRHVDATPIVETDGTDDDQPPAVVKVKRFAIEPMFEEDAVSRMEELGHAFFIFVNAESERVAVLYRRKDGRYGLIEPTIGGSYGASG